MSKTTSSSNKLKVFVSSKMAELRDVREVVAKALDDKGIHAWVYESCAGARPEDVMETSLSEVEASDIYVGLFWEKYGDVTAEEYHYARGMNKPCFVYIRDKNCTREQKLNDFLRAEVYDLQKGVTYDYFDSAIKLGEQIADDIMIWLVKRHREMTAEIREARVSRDEIARLQAEVDRLQATSRERLPLGTAVDYLAQQTRIWFETLDYRFESHEIRTKDYFEWIINVPARRRYDRILVRGIEGEAEVSDVSMLRQAVDHHKTDEGWLLVARRKSQAASEAIEKQENHDLFCYTFDELLDENADFSGYLNWLETEIKRQGIDKMYVPLACTKEEFDPIAKKKIGESHYDEHQGWIDGYIDRWLDDPSKEHISILGEFGTGKTWFALHYAWTALQRYRDAKARGVERPRLPLVIPLRDYAKAVSVESLFSEFFFRKYEIPLPGYSAFEQLNRMGKLLLIFDGFDEMAARVDRQKMINNFWELARVVVPGAKAILTCRTEHFPEAKEGRALLNAELQASTSNLAGEPPQFEVLVLSHFNDAQIHQALSLRSEATPSTVRLVMGNPQLLDLARRPVMNELILEALPDIGAGKPVDLSRVYLYAVRNKMERAIKEERTFTSFADKLYFLCELSWEMLLTNQMSLNYRLFPDRLQRLFGPIVQEKKDMDHWHYDMMGQTMLIRNDDGDYTPAHRSLLEFFVAYKFAAEMGVLASDFIEPARAQSHVYKGLQPHKYTWSSYFERRVDERGMIRLIPPLQEFVVEDMDKLVATVGKRPISDAVLELMQNMLAQDKQEVNFQLLTIIGDTRKKEPEEVGFIGGNAASLLIRHDPLALRSQDLPYANLSYTDFDNADLTGCNLQGANLQYAKFGDTILEDVNLCDGDLTHAEFAEIKGVRSIAFSPNGKSLASGGDDIYVHVWDVKTGSELKTLRVSPGQEREQRVHRVEFDRFGHFLGAISNDVVQIWDAQDLSLEKTITSKELGLEKLRTFCFSPCKPYEITIGGDYGLITLDLSTKGKITWKEITQSVLVCQYSSDGRWLAVGLAESLFVALEVSRQKATYTLKEENRSCLDLCLSKDNTHMVIFWGPEENEDGIIRNGVVKIYAINQNSINLLHSIDQQQDLFSPSSRIDFLCNNKLVAIAGIDGNVTIIDLASGNWIKKLIGHKLVTTTVSLSPDATLLATSSIDASINFWDARAFITPLGEPLINMVDHTTPELSHLTNKPTAWPEWWQKCRIDVPNEMIPNPYLGTCLRTVQQKLNCRRLRLVGTKGLDAPMGTKTLGSWLKERGAYLQASPTLPLDLFDLPPDHLPSDN